MPEVVTKRIPGIRALQHRADDQSARKLGRHVFHRMHGDVGAPLFECDLEFLDEQTLAADGGQGAVLNTVALRQQRHQLDFQPGMRRAQQRRHMLRLPKRQLTLARGDAQPHRHMDSGFGGNSLVLRR